MPAAQLYMSGMKYRFNTHRMFFDRLIDAKLCEAPFVTGFQGGGLDEIKDDQLYRVVTGMYSAQMLGTVKAKSMGLLSLEPKMADGTPVTDFNACILRDADGNEIKEWYALAAYLQNFGEDGVHDWYTEPDGRKGVSDSWNPVEHLVDMNWITVLALAIIILQVLLLAAAAYGIARHRRRKKGYSK